jgi:uncharacterized cupin superfamily protein/MoaA/NifB/PqqE/SkfB family radical SAM enzyme
LGVGSLKFADFKRFVDENPWISAIELSNWGEIFLNNHLIKIVKYAYRKNVALSAANGANLNHLPEDYAETLVRYRFRSITCSIDGASQETYALYRVNGDLRQVIDNVKTINRYKAAYRSPYPKLAWQFVVFGHNEHEIATARAMARELDMGFSVKLSWDDLYLDSFSPVRDKELVRRETGLGVASRDEFREKHGKEYALRDCCTHMWRAPQINFDGRVLGCCVNHWDDYGNAFEEGLPEVLNGERMTYARAMLKGEKGERADIPCVKCRAYQQMKATGMWLQDRELLGKPVSSRWENRIETLKDRSGWTTSVRHVEDRIAKVLNRAEPRKPGLMGIVRRGFSVLAALTEKPSSPTLESGIHFLTEPFDSESGEPWQWRLFFEGRSRNVRYLTAHMSELVPGHSPHPPHRHREEEILILLDGEVRISLPDLPTDSSTTEFDLRPGHFVYYPAFFSHTLTNMGSTSARYLMFKWHNPERTGNSPLAHQRFHWREMLPEEVDGKVRFRTREVFDGPTEMLGRLGCHTSLLPPGEGYPPHSDPYEVAIVTMEGEVETLGRRVGPGSLILYAAGEPHGMRNPGRTPARYLVFELQGRGSILSRAMDPSRWRRKLRSLLGSV